MACTKLLAVGWCSFCGSDLFRLLFGASRGRVAICDRCVLARCDRALPPFYDPEFTVAVLPVPTECSFCEDDATAICAACLRRCVSEIAVAPGPVDEALFAAFPAVAIDRVMIEDPTARWDAYLEAGELPRFEGMHWRQLPSALLARHATLLGSAGDRLFVAVLPAYLRYLLHEHHELNDLPWHLAAQLAKRDERACRRIELLTPAQHAAIRLAFAQLATARRVGEVMARARLAWGASGDDVGDDDGDGDPPSCVSTGVAATPTKYTLPPGYTDFYGVSRELALCDGSNVPAHVVMDLTGDRTPDLVVTQRCDDTVIDREHWLVYPGSATGFAATPTTFALPPDYSDLLGVSRELALCGDGRNVPAHVVMDLTGDRTPDLVVTQRCDDTVIDREHWLVYPGSATGFAATPTRFALPPDYSDLLGVSRELALCGDGRNVPAHVVMDLTGDRTPDLVVTQRCDDTVIDREHWLVYPGSATGFAATPTTFALPPGYSHFYGVSWDGALCDDRNVPQHLLADVDGDARPDLLVTDRCDDDAIDRDHWLVYPSFEAAPRTFALPTEYSDFYGASWEGALCDDRDVPEHLLLDADGDGRLDLLVTDRCDDPAIDRDHWLVYTHQCAP